VKLKCFHCKKVVEENSSHFCKRPAECMKSKTELICEVLEMIGFGEKKSIYSDGNFSKEEIFAVHQFVKEHARRRSK